MANLIPTPPRPKERLRKDQLEVGRVYQSILYPGVQKILVVAVDPSEDFDPQNYDGWAIDVIGKYYNLTTGLFECYEVDDYELTEI